MSKRSFVATAVCAAALCGALAGGLGAGASSWAPTAQASVTAADATDTTEGADYEPEVALIQVDENVSLEQINASLQAGGPETADMVAVSEVADGCVRVELAEGSSVEEAVDDLMEQGIATAAQPNYCYVVSDADARLINSLHDSLSSFDGFGLVQNFLTGASDKSDEDEQPSLSEKLLTAASTSVDDPKVGEQWGLSSIGIFDAWDIAKANKSVTVALLDLGCDVGHEDLKQNIVATYNAYNAVNGGSTTDVSPLTSDPKHGTHVAGIVSAVANNGVGVTGATYNAQILPVKVVNSEGLAYTDELVKAYDYLIDNASTYNIRVANLSMGTVGAITKDDAFLQAIDRARSAGIITVAAAGNRFSYAEVPYDCYPSDYANVVSVIALKQSGTGVERLASSNYNAAGEQDKNISAPGYNIYSTIPNSYGILSGTSMAAPHVSSILALEFVANPSLTADEAVQILYATATDIGASGWDNVYGYGEANAAAAVKAAADANNNGNVINPEQVTEDYSEIRTCPCYTIYR